MTCAVCRRKSPPQEEWVLPTGQRVCSRWCFTAIVEETIMVDPDPLELDALVNASSMGGEYLESIHKTDLAKLSVDEWMTFINVVCTAFDDSKQRADRGLDLQEEVTGTPLEPPF